MEGKNGGVSELREGGGGGDGWWWMVDGGDGMDKLSYTRIWRWPLVSGCRSGVVG
jgi:hypothetical protein